MTCDVPKAIIKRGPGMFKSSHCKQCTAHCINISSNMMGNYQKHASYQKRNFTLNF